jgi:hypothetical protein
MIETAHHEAPADIVSKHTISLDSVMIQGLTRTEIAVRICEALIGRIQTADLNCGAVYSVVPSQSVALTDMLIAELKKEKDNGS